VSGEEAHLAICRASDFVVTRTAGGVLSGAETQRPSVLVDEPGHWLGTSSATSAVMLVCAS